MSDQDPLRELNDGIARLKELAAQESDAVKKESIIVRIADIESRRDAYVKLLRDGHG